MRYDARRPRTGDRRGTQPDGGGPRLRTTRGGPGHRAGRHDDPPLASRRGDPGIPGAAPGSPRHLGRHPGTGRRDHHHGHVRLARRPAQPGGLRARRGRGPAGQHPVAAPGLADLGGARPATTRTARATSDTTWSSAYVARAIWSRRQLLRGDGRLLDQPPGRHRPLGRGVGQRPPLPPRRHPQVRRGPVRRHARRRRQAPGHAGPARQRVVDQACPQRELRPRGARAAHRRRRRRLPRESDIQRLGARPHRDVDRRTSPASTYYRPDPPPRRSR